ncbi:putative NAD/NADP octopine/nopaline dehydrogenase [Xylariaceae sp. FL0255]|nr:putative NAD/NADP octopine/nopaline dehydrogenase [Xylariaceae sp. FL0255]
MISSISIVGIGNCGCAFAADLESRGIKALLYAHPEHRANADAIRRNGYLDSIGSVEGRFYPLVSTDMGEALHFSTVIIIAVPSYAQDEILAELEKYDLSNHIIIAASGNFFSLVAAQRIQARYLLETSASPFGSRMLDGKSNEVGLSDSFFGVHVLGFKTTMPIGSLPIDMSSDLRDEIQTIFPKPLQWCSNTVEAAFYNFNGILHPITAVMNAGWIEHTGGDFYFYRQGMTPAVTKIMEQLDNERVEIAKCYGAATSCLDQMNLYYGLNHGSLNEFAEKSKLHSTLKVCPSSMQHRYLLEDLPYVLVPWYELGRKAGKESPFIRSLILWSSMINGTDYLRDGRNLKVLGFESLSLNQVQEVIMATSEKVSSGVSEVGQMISLSKSSRWSEEPLLSHL